MAEFEDRRKDKGYRGSEPFRVRWSTDELTPSGKPRRLSRSFAEEGDALDFQRALEGDNFVDPRRKAVMVETLAEQWFATTSKLAPHTRQTYHKLLHGHVLPYFRRVPQNSVDWLMVDKFVTDKLAELTPAGVPRSATPGGSKYVRDMLSVLSLVMKMAIRAGLRTDNPAAGHEIKVRRTKLSEGNTITLSEAHQLVAATRDPYKPLVWLLIICGLRPAEVCGLRVEHIDFTRRVLHAVETINFVQGYGDVPATVHRGPTKSEAGDRFIPIPQFVVDDLAAMLAARSEHRGVPALGPDEPLFESIRGGKPLLVKDLRRRIIRPALEAAGLSTAIRTYDTRHSHAFVLVDDGSNMLEVAQRMGHDPIVLQRVYGHVRDTAQQRLTDRMAELIEAAAPASTPEPQANVIDLFSRKKQAQ